LTTIPGGDQNEVVHRLWRVALSTMLIACVGSSSLASCLPGDPKPAMEMACCQKGHDCGPVMQAADCCKSSRTSSENFVAVKPMPPVKPAATLTFIATVPPPASLITPIGSWTSGPSLLGSSPPPHLISASLRI
jgi:hypothetical protein